MWCFEEKHRLDEEVVLVLKQVLGVAHRRCYCRRR
jgi:hypothetical protein